MTSTVTGSDHPRIADITTDGAASVTPSESARPMRNRKLASDRDAHVEAALEIFVRRVDARAREERHHRQRQDHHRQRQAEVDLNETQAGGVRLARSSRRS